MNYTNYTRIMANFRNNVQKQVRNWLHVAENTCFALAINIHVRVQY